MLVDPPHPTVVAPTTRVPYLPGLDGMRALAVIAVILYHADLHWMEGGFLGVEVFFVISGYLITLLLLTERASTGRLDLKQFWVRRARRLLPALFTVLAAVTLWLLLAARDEISRFRGEVVAALGYVTNWYLILRDSSYFTELGRPSPFRHLWSLAVEEQFYLFWPVTVMALLALVGFRRRRLALVLAGLSVASTLWMALLYRPGEDPSRVYFGTDTRLGGLLAGAALACVWRPWAARWNRPLRRPLVDAAGVVALVMLGSLHLHQGELSPGLYRGGFALVGVLTLVVIAAATTPGGLVARVLSTRPLVWVGTRSYGLYLWHWPVFVFTRPGIDLAGTGPQVWALRLGLTVALTEACYRFVEQPVRQGHLGRWWATVRHARGAQRRPSLVVPAAGVVAVLGLTAAVAAQPARPNEITESLQAGSALVQSLADPTPTTAAGAGTVAPPPATDPATQAEPTTAAPVETTAPPAPDTVPAETTVAAPAETTPPPAPAPGVPRIVALGDSVMLGAAGALDGRFGTDIAIDAVVSRQFTDGIGILQALRDQGRLPQVLVVHLGNNGTVSAQEFDQLMAVVADVPTVAFVNIRNNRSWEGSVNQTLADGVARYPNARLVDWYGFSAGQPNLFYKDGIHLRPEGAARYTELVAGITG